MTAQPGPQTGLRGAASTMYSGLNRDDPERIPQCSGRRLHAIWPANSTAAPQSQSITLLFSKAELPGAAQRQFPDATLLITASTARWQSRQADVALQDFCAAMQSDPSWDNARWVAALYSPTVGESVLEMKAEHERRLQDARRQQRLARGGLSR